MRRSSTPTPASRTAQSFDHGDTDGLSYVRWSGDGQRILTIGLESGAKVWDVSGRSSPVAELPIETPGGLIFAADINADGTAVVLTEGGNEAVIRRVEDGETTITLEGHTGLIQSLEFDSAGDRVLSTSDDGTARVWDAATGRQLLSLSNDGNPIRSAAWSADESLVATVGTNRQLRVWDAASGLEILRQVRPEFGGRVQRRPQPHRRGGRSLGAAWDLRRATSAAPILSGSNVLRRSGSRDLLTAQERELYLDR